MDYITVCKWPVRKVSNLVQKIVMIGDLPRQDIEKLILLRRFTIGEVFDMLLFYLKHYPEKLEMVSNSRVPCFTIRRKVSNIVQQIVTIKYLSWQDIEKLILLRRFKIGEVYKMVLFYFEHHPEKLTMLKDSGFPSLKIS